MLPSNATQRVMLEGAVAMRFQVAVPEVGQSRLATRNRHLVRCGHEAIMPDECHEVDAGRQREQALR